ncbi:addiction module protein [candidate division KSB1 bacterium]|nr:addiction module protein [candidate division KSB1 bacterium]
MSVLLKEIANKALDLSSEERAELVHELILSLDNLKDKGVEKAWDMEIEKRVKDIKNGTAKGRYAEDILAEIRAKYS